jgi:hypothetical protein
LCDCERSWPADRRSGYVEAFDYPQKSAVRQDVDALRANTAYVSRRKEPGLPRPDHAVLSVAAGARDIRIAPARRLNRRLRRTLLIAFDGRLLGPR